jgi:hypothetical protein
MKTKFNEYAGRIYSALEKDNYTTVLVAVVEASKSVGVHKDGESPELIWGEFSHLILGCHKNIYHPKNGYYSIAVDRSVGMKMKDILLADVLGSEYASQSGIDKERTVGEFLSDLMDMTRTRIDEEVAEVNRERVLKQKERDDTQRREMGYRALNDPELGNLFGKISRK